MLDQKVKKSRRRWCEMKHLPGSHLNDSTQSSNVELNEMYAADSRVWVSLQFVDSILRTNKPTGASSVQVLQISFFYRWVFGVKIPNDEDLYMYFNNFIHFFLTRNISTICLSQPRYIVEWVWKYSAKTIDWPWWVFTAKWNLSTMHWDKSIRGVSALFSVAHPLERVQER